MVYIAFKRTRLRYGPPIPAKGPTKEFPSPLPSSKGLFFGACVRRFLLVENTRLKQWGNCHDPTRVWINPSTSSSMASKLTANPKGNQRSQIGLLFLKNRRPETKSPLDHKSTTMLVEYFYNIYKKTTTRIIPIVCRPPAHALQALGAHFPQHSPRTCAGNGSQSERLGAWIFAQFTVRTSSLRWKTVKVLDCRVNSTLSWHWTWPQ